jgi:hypothetical protein
MTDERGATPRPCTCKACRNACAGTRVFRNACNHDRVTGLRRDRVENSLYVTPEDLEKQNWELARKYQSVGSEVRYEAADLSPFCATDEITPGVTCRSGLSVRRNHSRSDLSEGVVGGGVARLDLLLGQRFRPCRTESEAASVAFGLASSTRHA